MKIEINEKIDTLDKKIQGNIVDLKNEMNYKMDFTRNTLIEKMEQILKKFN